ncbi:uncharacterized protein B0H18DRAFT_1128830 [Fomitopsis serialis]|uniref:uncharacterized protein n=1 Tax=Fomitopsis serialis TaxID=139415 RepID=UPI00200770C4|nr:uncharacterized protein B0H18DRAFT_1128830 [Neoantrodia serialis]KAH9911342.1 hypothetical protein B0H18DRAFT_1128830 [Neoantrodia serialis]
MGKPPEAIQVSRRLGNMLTFFGVHMHAWISFRARRDESLLFVLVRAFVFELALPVRIIKKNAIVQPLLPVDPLPGCWMFSSAGRRATLRL